MYREKTTFFAGNGWKGDHIIPFLTKNVNTAWLNRRNVVYLQWECITSMLTCHAQAKS
jgi:hypothetical protein